ncbi:MAG TPA: hypothetical protein VLB29_11425 [Nocardioidaceae bacterium]|nr:hypothetical protein [Nocardioidaceae bacterium]
MNRLIRGSVAAALAASVALGVASAPAAAAPKAAHVKAEHKAAKAGKAKAAKADRAKAGKVSARKQARLTKAERRLTRHAKRKHAYLGRLLDARKLERLEDTVEAAVRTNIEGDIAELAGLIEGIAPAAGEDQTKPVDVRAYRPEVYHAVINQLRMATRLTDRAASAEQAGALVDLVTTLSGFDAETKRAQLRASKRMLISVTTAVEEAEETQTGETGTGETGTGETGNGETGTDAGETGADGTP